MEKSELLKELRKIGLPEKAALVYACLVDMGIGFPSKIADRTKVNRSTVYHTLNELVTRGLVSKLERGKKICFQIEKPIQLVSFAKRQIELAEERFERAKNILPEIEGLFALTPNKPRVRFFEGLQGVMAVYEDHVHETAPYEMMGYSNVEELMRVLPPAFVNDYVKQKQKHGITTRGIFPDTPFSLAYNKKTYKGIEKKFLVALRFTPAKDFPYKAEITMYGRNKVSIINFVEQVLIGVIIEDETIARMMRMIFELAWRGAKENR